MGWRFLGGNRPPSLHFTSPPPEASHPTPGAHLLVGWVDMFVCARAYLSTSVHDVLSVSSPKPRCVGHASTCAFRPPSWEPRHVNVYKRELSEGSSIRMTRTCKELDATGARARHCWGPCGWDMHTPPSEQAGPGHALMPGASHYTGCRYLCTLCPLFFSSAMSVRPCPLFLRPRKHARRVRGHSATFLDTLYIVWWRLLPGSLLSCEGIEEKSELGGG